MKLEDITLNHIRILKAVHDSKSFSKAAKELGYSQGLVSKKVKQLEDYFGTRLLKRSPGLVSLTSKGEKLIARLHNLYEDVEALQHELQSTTLDLTNQELIVGTTTLLAAVWFEQYLNRLLMCFPERKIQVKAIVAQQLTQLDEHTFDFSISHVSSYQSQHCCSRLQTHRLFWIDFSISSRDQPRCLEKADAISFVELDLTRIILLEEIYEDLIRSNTFKSEHLKSVQITDDYDELITTIQTTGQSTILPEFCLPALQNLKQSQIRPIQDVGDYGIYIHVPSTSELLILAESLVRSFQLDENDLESSSSLRSYAQPKVETETKTIPIRIGLQRDSIGNIIAAHGVAYIAKQLSLSSPEYLSFPTTGIKRNLELEINVFASSDWITRQLKQDTLDICLLDDMALLNNGSTFFDDLSFGSKLIGISSYNISGIDISVVVPKTSNIKSVIELTGKRISVLFGSNAHRFIITIFDLCGFDIDTDCTLLNEDSRTASSSLLNHQIDAHICCETFAAHLVKHKFAKRLERSQEVEMHLPSLRGIVCSSQFIRDHTQLVITYLYHLVIANYWFLSNPLQAAQKLAQLTNFNPTQILHFFDVSFGSRIDPTLKPQWSWLLKTLNRRLEGRAGISKFDVDFWIDDYFLRLTYNLLGFDYHIQQVSFTNEFSPSYFTDENFSKYLEFLSTQIAS